MSVARRSSSISVLALATIVLLAGCGSGDTGGENVCDPYGKDMSALGVARRPLETAGARIAEALEANMATFRETGSLRSIPEVRAALVQWSRAAGGYLADVNGVPMNTAFGNAMVDRIADFTPLAQALVTGIADGTVTTAQAMARFDDLDQELTAAFNAELKAKAPPECVGTDPDTGEMVIRASSE